MNFIFYALVLVFSMCLMHPAYLLASFCGAAGYCARVQGGARVRRTLLYLLPMMLLAAILNPAFNHEGVTILTYLPSGKDVYKRQPSLWIDSPTMFLHYSRAECETQA